VPSKFCDIIYDNWWRRKINGKVTFAMDVMWPNTGIIVNCAVPCRAVTPTAWPC
jgi:hypothetical protein